MASVHKLKYLLFYWLFPALILSGIFSVQEAQAGAVWTKKKPITITNTYASTLTDYQVKVDVTFDPDMKSDFSDLRFTYSDDRSQLSYWIESYTASTSAVVWVKVPSIPGSSTKTIYMYYGNPYAVSASDGDATFDFFDDFTGCDGSSLDSAKWNTYVSGDATATYSGYVKIYNNKAKLYQNVTAGCCYAWAAISSKATFNTANSYLMEADVDSTNMAGDSYNWFGIALPNADPRQASTSNRIMEVHRNNWALNISVDRLGSSVFETTESVRALFHEKFVISGNTFKVAAHDGSWRSLSDSTINTELQNTNVSLVIWQDTPAIAGDDIQVDNVRVRKYTSPEPTTSAGAETAGTLTEDVIEQQINIIDQTYSTISTTDAPTDNSFGIVRWNSSSYTNPTVYFEAILKTSNTSGSATATLYTTGGCAVYGSSVSTSGTSYTRVRSGPITLTDGTDYTVSVKTNNAAYTTSIKAARLIIIQSVPFYTPISKTETQIEVGNSQTINTTSYLELTDPKYYYYDSTKFDGTITVYFEATLLGGQGTPAGQTAWARLYNKTDGTAIAEVTNNVASWTRVRSGAITLTSGKQYVVQVHCDNAAKPQKIANAKIIIDSSDFTKFETVQQYVNTLATDTDSTYTLQEFKNQFNPGNWSGVTNTYSFETTMKTSAGTGYADLYDGSNPIASSELSTTSTSYTRVRSADISSGMPTSATDIDTRLKNSATNTTSCSNSWLIIQVGYSGPTLVELISFSATDHFGKVAIQWRTGYEVDNLGFNVYREENGQLYRLTPELIAGSALLAGSGTALTAGRHYSWWDITPSPTLPPQGGGIGWGVQYWLEDKDLNGKRTMHGPVTPVISYEPLPEKVKPEFLSEFGMKVKEKYRDFWRAQKLRERLGQRHMKRTTSPQSYEQTSKAFEQPKELKDTTSIKIEKTSEQDRIMQWFLASRPAVKILVKEEGCYRITQPELVAAGFNSRVNPRYLQLFADGEEQPILVKGEKDGRFDLQDAIEFYGVGLDTPSTDKRVYWLVAGSRAGKRIQLSQGQGGQLAASSFPYTVEKKDRTIYFAALKNGDADNFFGPVIAAEPVDQIINVQHLDPSPKNALLEAALQGVTNRPHRIKVLLNNVEVGEVVFEGQSSGLVKLTIPQSLLLEGENLVTFIAQNGEMDISLLDYIRLTYWHTYTADDDALKFTAQGGKQVSINGFSNSKIRVMDITDPKALYEITGSIKSDGTGYSITFRAPGTGLRTLLAFTDNKVKNPAGIKANQPSSWNQTRNGYDLVIISHKDFLQLIGPLKNLRQSQGLSVALIDIEDLYDEFNFGAKSPQAIKDFLSLAKKQWYKPPRFVLLAGDASFDPRNYLGFGDLDFVPTKLIDTSYLETASDDWFVDLNGDGLPDMAIGRLPVRTSEEANTVISKITGYERSSPIMEALLVADKNDEFDFEGATEEVRSLLPFNIRVREIFRGSCTNAGAKAELLSSIDQGPLFVNYTGHGSVEIWRGNILTSDDAEGLINGMRMPFVVSMTCLNGFFHDLYTESLAEALLKARQGGAMAVWASSGLTEPEGQVVMDKELIRLLFNDNSLTIGEATAKAKASVGDQDIRRTWILFGDPTTRLK